MAARGSESKVAVTAKILEMFPDAFQYDKEIRIPMIENGEEVQIKVTLTAAKTNVEHGGDVALPGEKPAVAKTSQVSSNTVAQSATPTEPTDEEKANLQKLIASLF